MAITLDPGTLLCPADFPGEPSLDCACVNCFGSQSTTETAYLRSLERVQHEAEHREPVAELRSKMQPVIRRSVALIAEAWITAVTPDSAGNESLSIK